MVGTGCTHLEKTSESSWSSASRVLRWPSGLAASEEPQIHDPVPEPCVHSKFGAATPEMPHL